MMRTRKAGAAAVIAVAALGCGVLSAPSAHADILLESSLSGVTATPAGTYIYEYRPFVTTQTRLDAGDFFTFYDFNGFVRVVESPASWTFTVQNSGPSPIVASTGTIIPGDDAGIPNVTFTWNGGVVTGGPTPLGVFRLESALGPGIFRPFGASGSDGGSAQENGNITNYIAPVPEPGEWAVAGIFAAGLVGLVVRARRRPQESGDGLSHPTPG